MPETTVSYKCPHCGAALLKSAQTIGAIRDFADVKSLEA